MNSTSRYSPSCGRSGINSHGRINAATEAHARLAKLADARVLGHLLASAAPRPVHTGPIRFFVPYYGGKFAAAQVIEQAMGEIVNLVIPFGGSLGCLLGRSAPTKVKTANDKDGLIGAAEFG